MGTTETSLSPELLRNMHAYWRAANYLSVGQIYLYDNPLLKEPLRLEHVKPRLLGDWGTTPGQNFIYVHLNRVITQYDLNMIYISGPGHGGPALVANTYLEGTYTELYPNVSQGEAGMKRLFTQFSFPGGIPSHAAPETIVVNADAEEAAAAVLKLGHTHAAVDHETLQLDLERLIQLSRVEGGGRWTDQVVETARRHSIRLPKSVIALTKGLILIESLALELDPELNLMQQIESVVGEMTVTEVKERLSIDLPEVFENYSSLLTDLPALLRHWLSEHEGKLLPAKTRGWFSRRKTMERRDER